MPASVKILFLVAVLAVVAALILWKAPGLFAWFGKLPGDIRWQGERSRVYFPLVSMLLLSVALTLLVNLVGWLLRIVRGG